MYFAPAVVLASIVCGGLATASPGVELALETRGLDPRDVYIIKTNSDHSAGPPVLPNAFRMMGSMRTSPFARPTRQSSFPSLPALPYTGRMQSSISPVLLNNPNGFSVQETLTFKPNRPARPTRLINFQLSRPQAALIRLKHHQKSLHGGAHRAMLLQKPQSSLRKTKSAHRALLLKKFEAKLKKKLATYKKKTAKEKAAKLKANKLAHKKKLSLQNHLSKQKHFDIGSAKSLKASNLSSKHHASKDASDWTSDDSSKKTSHKKSSKATSKAKSIFDSDSDKATDSEKPKKGDDSSTTTATSVTKPKKSEASSSTDASKPKESDASSSTGTSKLKSLFDIDSDKSKSDSSTSSADKDKRDESAKDRVHARSF